jgi:hypothetical protein
VFGVAGFFLIADVYIISTGDSASRTGRPPVERVCIMKKKISVYWPLALIVPCAAIAWSHAWNTAQQQMPLAADQLSAELARAVSYGLVGSEVPAPVKAPVKAIGAGEALPPSHAI